MSTRPAAAAPANAAASESSSLSFGGLVADYGLIGTVGLGALLLALVLAPLIGGYPPGALYGQDVALNALRALVCIAALCLGMGAGRGREASVILLGATFALTLLSLLVHSAFFSSPVLLYAMLPATLDWLCYALAFTLAWRLASTDRRAATLLIGALLVGAALTAVFMARDYGQSAQAGIRDYRAQGLFFSPNFAGGLLALTLPALTAACLAARERIGALVTGAAAALAFGALVATGSRAGVGIACLGLLVALVLALLASHRSGGENAAPALPWARVGALVAAFAVMAFAFRGPLLSRSGGDEHSGSFRTLTWQGTVAMAKANPLLGAGPGTFFVRYPRYAIVEKTDLAHSSYLQLAAEEGFPALVTTTAAILAALLAGVATLFRRGDAAGDDAARRLLLCGLIGGLIAGALRSLFDSEWALLGNGLPFWAMAGLAASSGSRSAINSNGRGGWGVRAFAAAGLVLSFVLLYGAQARNTVLVQARKAGMPPAPVSVWPPDPNLLFATGQPEEAVRVEPSGKRLYQLARVYQRAGDLAKAVDALKRAVDADPNSFQTWKLLADVQEASGDHAGALNSWRELTRRYEGPAGQVRAIPEMTETYPAFAYAALGDDAAARGDAAQAAALYAKAAAVIEAYAGTSPLYQQMEIASASLTGVDVAARRQEVSALYTKVIAGWMKAAPGKTTELTARRDATRGRIAKMAQPANSPAG